MKHERYILSILFVVAGLAAFASLAYWLWEGQQEAMGPTSTDWPEWKQKEWEKEQKRKGPPRYPQPTNYDASP
jgi:hypothetical protein